MANTRSAKKRVRASVRKRNRNRATRSAVKTLITRARRPADSTAGLTSEEVRHAISALDKAAEKGVLHPNNASRRKSRLMSALSRIALGEKPAQKAPAKKAAAPAKTAAAPAKTAAAPAAEKKPAARAAKTKA